MKRTRHILMDTPILTGSLTLGANYQLTRDRANGSGHGVYETFMVDGFFGHLNEDNHRCARCRYFHGRAPLR